MQSQSKHAHKVVKAFKKMIPEDAAKHLSEEYYEELALLIEAAIDSSLVEQLENAETIAKKAVKEIKALGR